jgi:hypothetical protein
MLSCLVAVDTSTDCFKRRRLYSNKLTGSIPSTIGRLTALTLLYVIVLARGGCVGELTFSRLRTLKASVQQQAVRGDSRSAWTIVKSQYLVRVETGSTKSTLQSISR